MRAKGEGSVFRTTNNGEPTWCASTSFTSHDGKRRFIRGYGPTQQVAIQRRTRNLERAMRNANTTRRATTPNATTYLDTWLNDASTRLGSESLRKYRRDIEIHILPHVGTIPLENLDYDTLHKLFYVTLAQTTGSSARVHAYKTFSTLLNHAVKADVIVKNPLITVPAPNHKTVVRSNDQKWIGRRMSYARNLIKWISDPDNDYFEHYPRVLFMFFGLRRAELLGLTWDCVVNLDRKGKAKITVKQQLKRHEKHTGNTGWYIGETTKNNKDRTIYLPELWRRALILERKKQRTSTAAWSSNLIFLRPNGSPVTYNYHSRMWREILTAYINKNRKEKKPLTKDEYFRPHAARHLAASLMFEQGITLEVAQEILGHSDTTMTLWYTHVTRAKHVAAVSALEESFQPDEM